MSLDVLVVGAGPAGLATSHELTRAGVEHVVLERGDQIGQTWANLYDSLMLHSARRLSSLPGLAFPAGTPQFLSRQDFLAYLHRYAEVFRLPIRVAMEVTSLSRDNGTWTVTTSTGMTWRALSAVVATGIVANPVMPSIPCRDRFRGTVLHSVHYKRPAGFIGQRVLVVGAGNSAGDIAAELAGAGADVTVAVRSGALVVPREIAGIPIHYLAVTLAFLPERVQRLAAAIIGRLSELVRGAAVLPHPRRSACPQVPLIGFHLADAIRAGTIRLQGGIERFTEDGVAFTNGTARAFDVVILATGYRAALGFLDATVRRDGCGFARRNGHVASADHPNLFFVGHNYDARGGLRNIGRDAREAARQIQAGPS